MRNLYTLNPWRDVSPSVIALYGNAGDDCAGAFIVNSPVDQAPMRVIAWAGEGWDHVSVSRKNRCPNWQEMEHVKRIFFKDSEVAMQLHVTPQDHISVHPYCLHLWRPHDVPIPLPPKDMVG